VWVCSDELQALSDFMLIVQSIGRAVVPSQHFPKPMQLQLEQHYLVPVENCDPQSPKLFADAAVTVPIDRFGNIVPTKSRLDSYAAGDPKLKSQIASAVAKPN
jgi:hypothetical protein